MSKQEQIQETKSLVSKLIDLKQLLTTDLRFWNEKECRRHLMKADEIGVHSLFLKMKIDNDTMQSQALEASILVERLPVNGRVHDTDVRLKIRDIQTAIDILKGIYS